MIRVAQIAMMGAHDWIRHFTQRCGEPVPAARAFDATSEIARKLLDRDPTF
jgi:hypothetical protein